MLTTLPLLAAAVLAAADTTPAAHPTGDVLIVANQGDRTVHVVEAGSGRTLAVIPSAPAPHEVAVTRDGRWAVVTNYGDRTDVGHALTVIDVSTRLVARSIDLAPHRRPHGIAFLPGDSILAVTSEASRAVVLVDFRAGRVLRALQTDAQGTHILAVAGGGEKVYAANMASGTVSELDVAGGRVTRTFVVGPAAEGAAVSADGTRLWAASMGADSSYAFDTATGQRIAAVATPGQAYRVALTPDGRRALIPAPALNLLRVIDTATLRETAVALPGTPGGAVVSPDGRTAYVPLMEAGQVAVIDLATLAVTRRLPAGAGPDGIAVSTYFRR
ncbi:MAG TPA: YncE family protein [Longimicrobium sp.]|nr:YncE family protein [Longimicrobium sp.]